MESFGRNIPSQITGCALYKSQSVRYARPVAQLTFQRARTEENKRQRAEALVEAARSLALEARVASVTLTAAAVAIADAVEAALPTIGRAGAFDIVIAAYSLASAFWHIANPPERLTDAYADEPDVLPPEWNIDFASALTRVLTATCVGLEPGSS